MPKLREMRQRKCIVLLEGLLSNPNVVNSRGEMVVDLDNFKFMLCHGADCSHWIWDEPYTDRATGKPLGENRRGHCGKTQHKPFVVQGLPKEMVDEFFELMRSLKREGQR